MTTTNPSPTWRLTTKEIGQFQDDGYLLFKRPVFTPERFATLKEHFEAKLAGLPPDVRPEAMDVPHFTDPKLFDWLLADEVLDIVEPLIGPDIALFSSHFICKPKGDGRRVPWHEDSAYWKRMLDPMEVVTIWLAIDPSTEENGCMYVLPHTHNTGRKGFSDYDDVDKSTNVFATEIRKEQRDDRKSIPCILQPNEASLHDGRLMHGSPPNTSEIRRCGYTMRYIPTSTVLQESVRDTHRLFLARGRDQGNQPGSYAEPGQVDAGLIAARKSKGKRVH